MFQRTWIEWCYRFFFEILNPPLAPQRRGIMELRWAGTAVFDVDGVFYHIGLLTLDSALVYDQKMRIFGLVLLQWIEHHFGQFCIFKPMLDWYVASCWGGQFVARNCGVVERKNFRQIAVWHLAFWLWHALTGAPFFPHRLSFVPIFSPDCPGKYCSIKKRAKVFEIVGFKMHPGFGFDG